MTRFEIAVRRDGQPMLTSTAETRQEAVFLFVQACTTEASIQDRGGRWQTALLISLIFDRFSPLTFTASHPVTATIGDSVVSISQATDRKE